MPRHKSNLAIDMPLSSKLMMVGTFAVDGLNRLVLATYPMVQAILVLRFIKSTS